MNLQDSESGDRAAGLDSDHVLHFRKEINPLTEMDRALWLVDRYFKKEKS